VLSANDACARRWVSARERGVSVGRRSDMLRVTLYDSANQIVLQFDSVVDGGNVQSVRLRH